MNKAAIICIGDEILIGQVLNTNAHYIAKQCSKTGIEVVKIQVCADEKSEITNALNDSIGKADILITSGGLGPTKDDISKEAIADFFGLDMVHSEEQWEHIEAVCEKYGVPLSVLHKSQALIPEGTILIQNELGTALGLALESKNCKVLSMPGVPYEMRFIMENGGLDFIRPEADFRINQHTFTTFGVPETDLAERLSRVESGLAKGLSISYLPSRFAVRIRITEKSNILANPPKAEESTFDKTIDEIRALLGDGLISEGDKNLDEVVAESLLSHNVTIATAESCTGGALAGRIVTRAGASRYFKGSVVAYSNEIKSSILHVSPQLLKEQGAVSEEAVAEMVYGICDKFGVDCGIAVSGIAGPDGGSEEKPVGSLWLACGNRERISTKFYSLGHERESNIADATTLALNMFRKYLKGD